jgi:hypothetical protein
MGEKIILKLGYIYKMDLIQNMKYSNFNGTCFTYVRLGRPPEWYPAHASNRSSDTICGRS